MKNLPILEKQSKLFDLIIKKEAMVKINYHLYRFAGTEWSGVLLYTTEGAFMSKDFKVIVEDFQLMDIGTVSTTEFTESPEIVNYMIENGLLDCKRGLIHSHHTMSTFFSVTDTDTLRSEGNDTCHFLSLIVNNDGKYNAAITRKVTRKYKVRYTGSYDTYGGNPVGIGNNSYTSSEEVIEYFHANITKEEEVNPLFQVFEKRIEEVKRIKAEELKNKSYIQYQNQGNNAAKYNGYQNNGYQAKPNYMHHSRDTTKNQYWSGWSWVTYYTATPPEGKIAALAVQQNKPVVTDTTKGDKVIGYLDTIDTFNNVIEFPIINSNSDLPFDPEDQVDEQYLDIAEAKDILVDKTILDGIITQILSISLIPIEVKESHIADLIKEKSIMWEKNFTKHKFSEAIESICESILYDIDDEILNSNLIKAGYDSNIDNTSKCYATLIYLALEDAIALIKDTDSVAYTYTNEILKYLLKFMD